MALTATHHQCRLSLHTPTGRKIPRPLLCRTTVKSVPDTDATMPTLQLLPAIPGFAPRPMSTLFSPTVQTMSSLLPHKISPASSSGPDEIKVSRPSPPHPSLFWLVAPLIRNSRNMLQPVGQTITKSCLETQSKIILRHQIVY